MEALVSIAKKTREVVKPLGVPAEEDRVSAVGAGDWDMVYHINGKEVTKEDWMLFHKNQEYQKEPR